MNDKSNVTYSYNAEIDYPPLFEILGDNEIAIYINLEWLSPDRTQYKVYTPRYSFKGLLVKVTVTLDMVVKLSDDPKLSPYIILTPAGVASIADQLASSLDAMHDIFRGRDRKF